MLISEMSLARAEKNEKNEQLSLRILTAGQRRFAGLSMG